MAEDKMEAKMEWLPIESAPRDEKIMVYSERWGIVAPAYWSEDKYARKPSPYWTHYGEHLWGKRDARANQPTHWMPLPQPPAAPEKSA